jgi:hypothetical protein
VRLKQRTLVQRACTDKRAIDAHGEGKVSMVGVLHVTFSSSSAASHKYLASNGFVARRTRPALQLAQLHGRQNSAACQGAPRVYFPLLVSVTQAANDIALVGHGEMRQVVHI